MEKYQKKDTLSRRRALLILAAILLLSAALNLHGIDWGIPSMERSELQYGDRQGASHFSDEEIENVIKKSRRAYELRQVEKLEEAKEYDIEGSRSIFSPIRSYHPDEYLIFQSISNMNPDEWDFNPHFFTRGSFFIYSVAAALKAASMLDLIHLTNNINYYLAHPDEFGKFYLIGRVIAATYGILAVYMVYLLASVAFNRRTGLFAAAFVSVMPAHVVCSHYMEVDVPMTFWLLAALVCMAKMLRSERLAWCALSGAFVGLAAATKLQGGFLLPIIAVACLLYNREHTSPEPRSFKQTAAKRLLVTTLACVVAFLVVSPYTLLDYQSFKTAVFVEAAGGRSLGHFGLRQFFSTFFTDSVAMLRYVMCTPLLCLAGVGALVALCKRRSFELLLILALVIFWIPFGLSPLKFAKDYLPIGAIGCVLAARVLTSSVNTKSRMLKVVVCVIAICVFCHALFVSASYSNLFAKQNVRTEAGRWIAENIPSGATIGTTKILWQYEMPPIDGSRYNLVITGESFDTVELEKPPIFVASSAQYDLVFNTADPSSQRFRFWKKLMSGEPYTEMKIFRNYPSFLGRRVNDNKAPEDMRYVNPRVVVYQLTNHESTKD